MYTQTHTHIRAGMCTDFKNPECLSATQVYICIKHLHLSPSIPLSMYVYLYIYINIYIYRGYRVQAAGLTRTHYKHIMAPHYPTDGESASYASVYHECANLYRDFANCVYV